MHEASLHEDNVFWTLTYDDEHLPPYGSLRMDDVSALVKKLRKLFPDLRFKYQARSEYGPETLRPHYHGIFFGLSFPDRQLWRKTEAGAYSYVSEVLTNAWGKGNCEVSDLTPGTAAYVAGHQIDKLNGPLLADSLFRLDAVTGELVAVEAPSARGSNRPGIGARWLDQFERDAFPSGFLILNGQKKPIPPYYKRRLKDRFELVGSDPDRFVPLDDAEIMARKSRARARTPQVVENSTPERLAVREEVLRRRLLLLKRNAI